MAAAPPCQYIIHYNGNSWNFSAKNLSKGVQRELVFRYCSTKNINSRQKLFTLKDLVKNTIMKKIILLFFVATMTGCFGTDPVKTGKEGKPVPEFNLLLTDSSTWFKSANIPTGKPFVLFYFSPYCPYCKAQTKQIVDDMDRLKNIHFYFVSHYSLPEIKSFCKEFQLSKYSNITAGLDTANTVSDYFEIAAIPYLAIYNEKKILNKTFVGKIYNSQIIKATEQ
jgi:thiol-disulfide isomerase/thioredoxin